jgi:N-acetylglucosaminyl-diphospho-decaprenol L-rhamnosyltransferase
MSVQVAVVVVSYNTKDLLLECLASVFDSAQNRSIELVVVDNASEDGSSEAVREAYSNARLIQNATNLGFGAACNQGIRATSSKFILLLNSDARLTAEAFQALCDCLEQNERCGAAGCRLIDEAGAEVINARNFLTPLNQAFELAGIRLGSGWLRRTRPPNLDRNLVDCSVDWIDGACLMLRRAALDEAGLFDERFFMYSEDEDLCFRLRESGWLVCFCGAGTAVHHGAASSGLRRIEMLRHFYVSQMCFLSKHRSRRSALLYAVLMKTVLVLKHRMARDSNRRSAAEEQRAAFNEACTLFEMDRNRAIRDGTS